MKIVIFNDKGGTGKTSIAHALARDLNFHYSTNDFSKVLESYGNKARFEPSKISIKDNTIYDFGGFKTDFIYDVILKADVLIVPMLNDYNSTLKAILTINDYLKKGIDINKIILVGNAIKKASDSETIERIMKNHFKDLKIVFIRNTELFKNCMDQNKGAFEIYSTSGLTKHTYENVISDYSVLLKEIHNIKNNIKNIETNAYKSSLLY